MALKTSVNIFVHHNRHAPLLCIISWLTHVMNNLSHPVLAREGAQLFYIALGILSMVRTFIVRFLVEWSVDCLSIKHHQCYQSNRNEDFWGCNIYIHINKSIYLHLYIYFFLIYMNLYIHMYVKGTAFWDIKVDSK